MAAQRGLLTESKFNFIDFDNVEAGGAFLQRYLEVIPLYLGGEKSLT